VRFRLSQRSDFPIQAKVGLERGKRPVIGTLGIDFPAEAKLATAPIPADRHSARIAIVEEHVRLENDHNLDGVLGTFGEGAHYDDEAWDEHFEGQSGVRQFY
jgi:hypothetical protein